MGDIMKNILVFFSGLTLHLNRRLTKNNNTEIYDA